MATKNNISGRNIYVTDKHQTVLYDKRSQKGYLLMEKDQRKMVVYQNRWLIVLLVFMFGLMMGLKWTTMLGISTIVAILLEYSYRMVFLRSLNPVKKFVPNQTKTLTEAIAETATKKTALTHGSLMILLGVLLVYNSFTSPQSSTALIVCSFIACAVCAFYGIAYLKASASCKE